MIYVRPITPAEEQELKRMVRQEVGRVSQRAQLVLLSAEHHSVPQLAQTFKLTRRTVRIWLRRFDQFGPAGLFDAPRSGRPQKLDPPIQFALLTLLAQDPAVHGYQASFWTVAMLSLAIFSQFGVQLARSTIRQALHRADWRWGRPRLSMPTKTDPNKAQKQWLITQRVVQAGADTAILYADESRMALLPLIRGIWHPRAQQVRIPTPGSNDSRTIFGALNIRTGRWDYQIREHMYTADFIDFLKHLLTVYPHGKIVLIVDNYSSHTAKAVKEWLGRNRRLCLLYLPTYCSHLDPVELIWLRLKDKVAANRLYNSIKQLSGSVDTFFGAMTPQQALTWAAVDLC